ncbi:anthrone oxygenase family protein [Streptosporangium sandarakinum]|uniref:anthrone oxygenase family protein n=1 Tax=Streptosporangium sandarakinum TaxID=1260955 RepID=UPI00370FEEC1
MSVAAHAAGVLAGTTAANPVAGGLAGGLVDGETVAAVAVLANGVAAGIMLSTVIGIAPMMLSLPYGRYVQLVQFMWPRFDPIMPITNGATLVLDVLLAAVLVEGPARWAFAAAALLQAAVMGVSVTRNVPVNRMVRALDPDRQPSDWESIDPRRRWRAWNAFRTSLALLAFLVNVVTTSQLA